MNYLDLFHATLPETILEIAALLVIVVDLGLLRKAALATRVTTASLLGIVGCLAAIASLPAAGPLRYANELVLVANNSARVSQYAILFLTVLTLLLFIGAQFTRHAGEYVSVVLMAAAGGMIIAAAYDLLVIFVGLELLSLGLYILTAFAKGSGNSAEAAIKYYLFGGMSAAFLLFGFSYLYGLSGSTNLAHVVLGTYQASANGGAPLLLVALVMIAAGLGFKIAAAPFHLWAPDTYEGAPAPAAAFIASVSKVASFGLLISISFATLHFVSSRGMNYDVFATAMLLPNQTSRIIQPVFGFRTGWPLICIVLSVISMIAGNLAALAQTSVRRLLAYSAVAHAGYILLGVAFFTWNSDAPKAILYYIITYGLTAIGAFAAIGAVENASGSDRMDAFLGLHKRNPMLAAVLLVLFLSLAGIPPLVGFWAKFNLFAVVLSANEGPIPFALVALAIAMSAVSLYYYLQVLKRVYVMPPVSETRVAVHPVTLIVLFAIAAAVVVLGCFPALLQSWIAGFYQMP